MFSEKICNYKIEIKSLPTFYAYLIFEFFFQDGGGYYRYQEPLFFLKIFISPTSKNMFNLTGTNTFSSLWLHRADFFQKQNSCKRGSSTTEY